ncbi:PREDICTED: olfactory receptor 1468-like [Nanorana parkeri]|uniref:olfactory receptor 1468-like n=1 Tax=Nanorana parkeri TaxID=125878 RepID=UPI0008547ECB|nr:PREDICTED: olfactory receptor 1468-like [Nanorana parkeri]
MVQSNFTMINEIHLLGFPNLYHLNIFLFILFFMIYHLTTSGNLLLIVVVVKVRSLHSPMYLFLTQLSLSDMIMANSISPILLHVLVDQQTTVTFAGCLAQFYFFSASLALESLLLTVMSYDRYLAICNPLRYNTIMNYIFCLKLILFSWLLSFSVILNHVLAISHLQFCGPNIIDHFFCDLSPLLELSCSDTNLVQIEVTILTIPMAVIPFLLIITSYCYIICTILRIPSVSGRQKAFSTCSSHLTVVSIYYGTLLCTYMVPTQGQSLTVSKVLSLLYTVMIPLINPLIYSLRNNDIREAFHKICSIPEAPQGETGQVRQGHTIGPCGA